MSTTADSRAINESAPHRVLCVDDEPQVLEGLSLQLGRRYDTYHAMIAPDLQRRGKKYLYEQVSGTVIFPTRLDYVEGLARTKISIPSSSSSSMIALDTPG